MMEICRINASDAARIVPLVAEFRDRAVILIQGKVQAETTDASVLLDSEWMSKHYF